MKTNQLYKDYCVGCGLCKSEFNCKKYKESGFNYFDISNVDEDFLKNVCPVSGKSINYYRNSIWGKMENKYYGWSNDKEIRYKASSGGIITSMAIFLLEKKYVDEIIQIRKDNKNPIDTVVVSNKTKKDVVNCVGSRYSNSSVLESLDKIIDSKKKYALIGRPCDILTLKNYQKRNEKYKNIIYTISFFCAGNPSDEANKKLIRALGISNLSKCSKMNYRGNGWPGYAIAKDVDGKEYKMRYAESWGNYLGRDIRLMCKFCIDGCGAAADISCGDAWYLDSKNHPMFDENEGRNLIFARTSVGDRLINEAFKNGYINIQNFGEDDEIISKIQPAQFQRTTTVISKIRAFKLFRRKTPKYKLKELKKLSKYNTKKNKTKIFIGTIKRILNKKM